MNRPIASRKRGAPGSSPLAQQQPFTNNGGFSAQAEQPTFDPNFDWAAADNLGNLNNGFLNDGTLDNSGFDLSSVAGYTNGGAQGLQNNQLVRRTPNQQQMMSRNPGGWQDTGGGGGGNNFASYETIDEDEDLEQKAAAARRDAQTKRKQIPPFVQKLSSFLDDNQNTDLIRWSDNGDSFIVLDEDEFARKLIPELFKHNNYASFVRQLNMYGFHKRVGLSDNSMKASENKRKTPSEYYNKYFKRGRPELLWLIQKPKNPPTAKRKRDDKAGDGSDDERRTTPVPEAPPAGINNAQGNTDLAVLPRTELNSLRQDLANLQKQQKMITHVIQQMKQQNDQFYRQATAFQDMHQRHEHSINAILTFLATFYNRSLEGQSNNMSEMFNQPLPQGGVQPGNIVDIGDIGEEMQMPVRRQRQQLLLPAPEVRSQSTTAAASPATTQGRSTLSPRPRNVNTFRNTTSNNVTPTPQGIPSPTVKLEAETPNMVNDGQDMMSMINAANNASPKTSTGLDFDSALHHFQNADGNTPLTTQQRNDVLSMMQETMGNGGGANSRMGPNPLTSPNMPELPLQEIANQNHQLDYLQRLTQEQGENVNNLRTRIHSLSPSGYFAGLSDAGAPQPPPDFNLDDWMLPPPENGEFAPSNGNAPDFDFGDGTGFEGPVDFDDNGAGGAGFLPIPEQGGTVESLSSRDATESPIDAVDGEQQGLMGQSPRKRRKAG